ncbi:hypothetical protein [Ornithinimicrobium sp. INDO-MA30-4]|uniref:hypothetical protein n=1 Tax=Ornithinimicrobium sp. INDO-MA30-4 TaxID=2908651 RepID=UPI001F462C63|nr:hypothetical protein [Ornithinimicrobium sp. INDO-MA30-4]UJH70215.1 hypothetical protein L0A91_13720 [Ornithinimicrobium sp. INDO-MA30-4]
MPTEAAVLNVREVARRQAEVLRGASWSLSEGPVTKAQLMALLSHSRDAGSTTEKPNRQSLLSKKACDLTRGRSARPTPQLCFAHVLTP